MRSIDRKGFTLIELILVMVIIGVLAAISVPMMSKFSIRAKKSEALAALGTIRTAERCYYVENGFYAENVTDWSSAGPLSKYIEPGSLDGKYFTNKAYSTSTYSTGAALCQGGVFSDATTDESLKHVTIYLFFNGRITGDL